MDKCAISWKDICATAEQLEVDPCAVKAVCQVESLGAGFLESGRPKILFEGHIFWKKLREHGEDPERHAAAHPNVVYRKWDRRQYKGGEAEHTRLEEACAIHRCAALESASWGTFQIMGFNYPACGYENVENFVEDHADCAATHLKAFCRLLRANRWHECLRSLDWAGFARLYNGPAYAENKYDQKLAAAYEKCREARKSSLGSQLEEQLGFLWKN